MDIVFMGTPDFAQVLLKKLYEEGHNIKLVVTQPDKPKGRGKEMAESAVKQYAVSVGIPVFQPVKIKTPEAIEELAKYEADIFVVAAFGQILSKEILNMPRFGCINAHASLLPKYRGASPIQWAIMNGEPESGVTIMQMDEGLDTGDMLTKTVVPILDTDTGESLHDKLALAGAELLIETLKLIEEGKIKPEKQPKECDSYAKLLNKQMGELDFSKSASENERLIRAFTPWPGTYTFINGKMLKIIRASVIDKDENNKEFGKVLKADKSGIVVPCSIGKLLISDVQLEGKKRMEVKDFLLGYRLLEGTALGRQV